MENTKPIRIAQILNKMDSGGIEAVVMNYYRNIDRNRIQFDFYFAEDSLFPQQSELESMGAGIYKIPKYTKVFKYQKVLQNAFKEKKYKVVHAHLNSMSVFPLFAAWRAKVPVRICHNHTTAHWGEGVRTILKYILRPFSKIFATDYFACSEKAGRWLYGNKFYEKGKVQVLNNAIDVEKFNYDKEARQTLRQELKIAPEDFVVGNVGRFMYQKNHSFLIDIFEGIKKQRNNAKLLLVGDGELQQEIINLVKEKGLEKDVIFTGSRNDVNKLYSVMDVFCLPSFYEGFSLVTLEAQANGLKCVCSSCVPDDACVTNFVTRLSLDEDINVWINSLLDCSRHDSEIPESFDIRNVADRITTFYEEKNCESRDKK